MTTLILLTPHPGGLDYDLYQTQQNITKFCVSTADPASLFGKNMNSTKARPAYFKHFAMKLVQQWVKKGQEIKAAITMPPRLRLSMLDRLVLNIL
jgi:hypothetical protein